MLIIIQWEVTWLSKPKQQYLLFTLKSLIIHVQCGNKKIIYNYNYILYYIHIITCTGFHFRGKVQSKTVLVLDNFAESWYTSFHSWTKAMFEICQVSTDSTIQILIMYYL